ncbi:PREDICTED: breast cancer anti-estrogen resistance protein 1-like [Priapulus caudatus]|uniref:Breast cancer anti-estrogen resistance protein 1-like n=1 Tax=Priapulus caudatus TaxID=37621 RepID=A0ABM1E0X7_PRICU|nr:PREDICTED: breast cancer anti-estrogen resistance protein 1-like [Priapulus caudatus]
MTLTQQAMLARALYDNIAESPDELAFRKGDIVSIIEESPGGLVGWWLCSLRGRNGIAPANRLRAMASGQPMPVEQKQAQFRRRSWNSAPNKVVTPQRVGDVYLYDVPPLRGQADYDVPHPQNIPVPGLALDTYDVPPSAAAVAAFASPQFSSPGRAVHVDMADTYSVPPHPVAVADDYDRPQSDRSSAASSSLLGGVAADDATTVSSGSLSSLTDAALSLSNPPSTCGSNRSSGELLDVYDCPPPNPRRVVATAMSGDSEDVLEKFADISAELSRVCMTVNATYDVPPGGGPGQQQQKQVLVADLYDVPPCNRPVLAAKGEAAKTKKCATPDYVHSGDFVYDVPPQVTKDQPLEVANFSGDGKASSSSASSSSGGGAFSGDGGVVAAATDGKELPLDLDAAMDMLVKLQQELQGAAAKLFGFVHSSWRAKDALEVNIFNIKLSCTRVQSSLREFLDFARGAVANAARCSDKGLAAKLARLCKPVDEQHAAVQRAMAAIDRIEWQPALLAARQPGGASLDEIVASARTLLEDARALASVIHANSKLLFKRAATVSKEGSPAKTSSSGKPAVLPKPGRKAVRDAGGGIQERPLPSVPAQRTAKPKQGGGDDGDQDYENDGDDWFHDYEYVQIDDANNGNATLKAKPKGGSPKKVPASATSVGGGGGDRQVLEFYASQIASHVAKLMNGIDAFLLAVENTEPPKSFIAHSKFVVLSTHRLVNIGDTLYRNVASADVKTGIIRATNALCDCLKVTVMTTKVAAQNYPQVKSMQDMVDSIVDISHAASELRMVVTQAASW